MTKREAEELITELWGRFGMEDHSGTDRVRDELVMLVIRAHGEGYASGFTAGKRFAPKYPAGPFRAIPFDGSSDPAAVPAEAAT